MKTFQILFLVLTSLSFFSCEEEIFNFVDNTPPAVPTNIVTDTGDNLVIISWNHVNDSDLSGYAVYYSNKYDGEYNLLGTTSNSEIIDYGAANGETYFYAVASYDLSGNESELSYDIAYDTPRPEGFDYSVFDFNCYPDVSGYDFSNYEVKNYTSLETDFFFENDNGELYLNVWEDSDIQNMGRTTNLYEISEAPTEGWIELIQGDNIKYVKAIRGNTYIIWTYDNHFAKIRITEIYFNHVEFDWAYQTAEGNSELKINRNSGNRSKPVEVIVNRKRGK